MMNGAGDTLLVLVYVVNTWVSGRVGGGRDGGGGILGLVLTLAMMINDCHSRPREPPPATVSLSPKC